MAVKQGKSPKVENRKKVRRGIKPGDKPVARKKGKKPVTGAANGKNNCFSAPQRQTPRPTTPVRLTNRPSDTTRPADSQPNQGRITTADAFMQAFTEQLNQRATKKRWSPELREKVNQFARALVYENSPMSLTIAGDHLHRANSTALGDVIYRFVATYRIRVGNPRHYMALQLPGTQKPWFLLRFDKQVAASRARRKQEEQLQSVS